MQRREEEAGDEMETGRCRHSKENLYIFSISGKVKSSLDRPCPYHLPPFPVLTHYSFHLLEALKIYSAFKSGGAPNLLVFLPE